MMRNLSGEERCTVKIANAASMKALDGFAINSMGVDSCLLMENAARAVADAVCSRFQPDNTTVAVFCGVGNNGGDGVACARFLLERGYQVKAYLCGPAEKMSADTREMERRLIRAGGCLELFINGETEYAVAQVDVIVDALFGTGLNKPLRAISAAAVRAINTSKAYVISCDVPSGIETDTGREMGDAVFADLTVTFTRMKPCHALEPGREHTGELQIVDIGIPEAAQSASPTIGMLNTEQYVRDRLPIRKGNTHKSNYGKLLLLCGSRGFTGAAALAARAALRSGAGLVSVGVPESVYPIVAAKLDEAMVFPLPDDGTGRLSIEAIEPVLERLSTCTACLIGPGLGRSPAIEELVCTVVSASRVPLVIDADGINALSRHMDILRGASCPVVLTPHDVEFARLDGDLINQDRITAVKELSRELNATVLLKGHTTLISSGTQLRFNMTGNPGMATGGSGDVLAGIIVSLIGQRLPVFDAACVGAWLHGSAGDLCAAEIGQYGMLPSDLIDMLPRLLP